jgi:atypical dual specificity phosphatase
MGEKKHNNTEKSTKNKSKGEGNLNETSKMNKRDNTSLSTQPSAQQGRVKRSSSVVQESNKGTGSNKRPKKERSTMEVQSVPSSSTTPTTPPPSSSSSSTSPSTTPTKKQKRCTRKTKKPVEYKPSPPPPVPLPVQESDIPVDWSGFFDCPEDWNEYAFGDIDPILDNVFIFPTKTPLGRAFKYHDYKEFQDYKERIHNTFGRDIVYCVDLSATRYPRYGTGDLSVSTEYKRFKTTPQAIPSDEQVDEFCQYIDSCREKDPDAIILVHCTHGINRTGYFLVHYLVKRFGLSVDLALATFAVCRKVALYDALLIETLFEKLGGKDCEMFKLPQYPRPNYDIKKEHKYNRVIQQRVSNNPLKSSFVPYGMQPKCKNIAWLREIVDRNKTI